MHILVIIPMFAHLNVRAAWGFQDYLVETLVKEWAQGLCSEEVTDPHTITELISHRNGTKTHVRIKNLFGI